jgi:ribosomal protein S18 acetylase RimI-like enzyme
LATRADAARLLDVQRRAFLGEAAIYGEYGLPPLKDSLMDVERAMSDKTVLKAERQGMLIGSVQAWMEGGACWVARLSVDPDCQNVGVGSKLMASVEERFPQAKRFQLSTGHLSMRNLYLYEKLGYREYQREPQTNKVILIYLRKERTP